MDIMNITLENYLHEQIPISKALGIRAKEATPQKVTLTAPLAENINHKKTVFGGSLHAVTTLACWSLIHLNLENSYEIVIGKSEIEYLKPVTSDFEATCYFPEEKEWQRFHHILLRKGKARLQLNAAIMQNNTIAVNFTGTFIAIK